MRVTYFANVLSDAAVGRRVRMLRQGGAEVHLFGFHRGAVPVREVEGVMAVDLGRTMAGRLDHRFKSILQCSIQAATWRHTVAQSDVVMARSLDMASIAYAAQAWAGWRSRFVYECLDIHGVSLGHGMLSKLLRGWERRILRRSAALIVSSEGFLTNYFDHLDAPLPQVILVENKRVPSELEHLERPRIHARLPPWRIGWFGGLRCAESFDLLLDLARSLPEHIDIVLRGQPAENVERLIKQHLPLANMRFGGAYAQTELAAIYGACDFTWAIEFAGQNAENAKWALGNRLYEGGFYNRPTLAIAGTAMANWLKARSTGMLLHDPHIELKPFFINLTPAQYDALQCSSANVPTSDLVCSMDECRRFVARLTGDL